MMFVREQPGDREDREGRLFVGPAGLLLDKALVEAGLDRKRIYVTNAVKHFKFEPRGERRLTNVRTLAKSRYPALVKPASRACRTRKKTAPATQVS